MATAIHEAQRRAGGRVLVVDDDGSVTLLLVKVLRRCGHDAVGALDCAQALRLLAEQEFDVLVVDKHLPSANGFDVIAAARRRNPEVGTVMISALPAWLAMDGGLDGFLIKPFASVHEVERCVGRALEARHQRVVRAQLEGTRERREEPRG